MDYPNETGFDGEPETVEQVADEPAADNSTEREPCVCGCGETPARKRSRFMPGHDAQLKSKLYRTLKDDEADAFAKGEAQTKLEELGWPLPAGVA